MNLGSSIRLWVGLGADALAYQAVAGWDGAMLILVIVAATFWEPTTRQTNLKD